MLVFEEFITIIMFMNNNSAIYLSSKSTFLIGTSVYNPIIIQLELLTDRLSVCL